MVILLQDVTSSGDNYPAQRENYLKITVIQQLEALDKYLGDNQWLTKDLSYVDFLACELLDEIRLFSTETIEKFPRLKNYLDRFGNLPPIKNYHSSTQYKSWPVWAPQYNWGFYE